MPRLLSSFIIGNLILSCTACTTMPLSNSSVTSVPTTSVEKPSQLTIPQATPSPAKKRVVGLIPIDRFPELKPMGLNGDIHANQPYTITVVTYGSSSCTTPDGATITVTDTTVTITPYNLLPIEGPCTDDLAEHPRLVEITFPIAGQSTIRIQGQNFEDKQTTFEQVVNVLP